MEPEELSEKYRVPASFINGAKFRKMLTLAEHFPFCCTHVITQI